MVSRASDFTGAYGVSITEALREVEGKYRIEKNELCKLAKNGDINAKKQLKKKYKVRVYTQKEINKFIKEK